jgi:hypothetical protein
MRNAEVTEYLEVAKVKNRSPDRRKGRLARQLEDWAGL